MTYDQALANRVREVLHDELGLREQRMFGGVAFLLVDTMAVAASSRGGLLVRVGPENAQTWADPSHAQSAEMHGRPMRAWLHVDAEAVAGDDDLRAWVDRGVAYARSLAGA